MIHTKTQQLPVVGAQEDSRSWLIAAQSALINTGGLFAISDAQGLNWERGSRICRKVLKAYMRATLHDPWELHSGLDVHKGQEESTSQLETGSVVSKERHVDRGLFNIVEANPTDRKDLLFNLDGRVVDALSLTKSVAAAQGTLLIVIPGYTLQFFEPRVQAVFHEVRQLQEDGPRARSTKVFRCRLRDDFIIHGRSVGSVLEQACPRSGPPPGHGPISSGFFRASSSSGLFASAAPVSGAGAPSSGGLFAPVAPVGAASAPSSGGLFAPAAPGGGSPFTGTHPVSISPFTYGFQRPSAFSAPFGTSSPAFSNGSSAPARSESTVMFD